MNPIQLPDPKYPPLSLSKREYFALMAFSSGKFDYVLIESKELDCSRTAEGCVEMADALIAELNKTNQISPRSHDA